MKVFVSWSGNRSKALADILRRWLPSVLQAVRPYYSPDDVAKGARWSSEIAKELEASRVGLLVLTPENQEAPWLLFEAGALAKNLDRSKVCPILFGGLEPTDVKGPLVQFQAGRFDNDDMKRVIKMMNAELGDGALAPDVLDSVFEMWFPRLSEQVAKALSEADEDEEENRRTDRELLEEVLGLTRSITRDRERSLEFEHPAFDDLFGAVAELVSSVSTKAAHEDLLKCVRRLQTPVEYFAMRGPSGRGPRRHRSLRHLMMSLEQALERDGKIVAPAVGEVDGAA